MHADRTSLAAASNALTSGILLRTYAVHSAESRFCGLRCCCKKGDKTLMFYVTLLLSLCIGFLGLFQVGMGMFIRVDSGNTNVLDAYLDNVFDTEEANVYFYALLTNARYPVESSFETTYQTWRERFSPSFQGLADAAWSPEVDVEGWQEHNVLVASWLQGFQEHIKDGDIDRHANHHFNEGYIAAETVELVNQNWMTVMGFGCTVFALGVGMLMSLWKKLIAPPLFIVSLLFGTIVLIQYGEAAQWPHCTAILDATGLSVISLYRLKDLDGNHVVYDETLHPVTSDVYKWIADWRFPIIFFYAASLVLAASLLLLVESVKLAWKKFCSAKDFSLGAMEYLNDQAEREKNKGDPLKKKFGDLVAKDEGFDADIAKTPKSKFAGFQNPVPLGGGSTPQAVADPKMPPPSQQSPPKAVQHTPVQQQATGFQETQRPQWGVENSNYSVVPYNMGQENTRGPKHNPMATSLSQFPPFTQRESHVNPRPSLLDRASSATQPSDPPWNTRTGTTQADERPSFIAQPSESFMGGPGGRGRGWNARQNDPNHTRGGPGRGTGNYGSPSSYGSLKLVSYGDRGSPSCQPIPQQQSAESSGWGTAAPNANVNGAQRQMEFRGGTNNLSPRKHRQSIPVAMPSATRVTTDPQPQRFRRNSDTTGGRPATTIRRHRNQLQGQGDLAAKASNPSDGAMYNNFSGGAQQPNYQNGHVTTDNRRL